MPGELLNNIRLSKDVVAVICATFIFNVTVALPPLSNTLIRGILGLVLVLFLAGYPASYFVLKGKHNLLEKAAVSFGLSLSFSVLASLALNFTSWGITEVSVEVTLSFIIYLCAFLYIFNVYSRLRNAFGGKFKRKTEVFESKLNPQPLGKLSRIKGKSIKVPLLTLLVIILVVSQASFRASLALNENKNFFTGSDAAQVNMPIIQTISATSHIPIFYLYAERGALDERVTLETLSASLRLVTGFSILQIVTIITILSLIIPVLFIYLLAHKFSGDKRVGLLSVVLFSAALPAPIFGDGSFYAFVLFPAILYFVLMFLDNNIYFLPVLLLSVVGYLCHPPLQVFFMLLFILYGLVMSFFSPKAHRNRLKYLSFLLLLPIVVLTYYPAFKAMVYPAVFAKGGESFVNQPFNLYINAVMTVWNVGVSTSLILSVIEIGLFSLIALYIVSVLLFRWRSFYINVTKIINPILRFDKLIISAIFFLPWVLSLSFANFNISQAFNSMGEFNRPEFYTFFILLLIGLFSTFFKKDLRFLILVYLPMVALIFKPITDNVGLGFLSFIQMDRGYYVCMSIVAIAASITIIGCFKKVGET